MRRLIEDMTNINTMKVGSKELDLHERPLQDAARAAQEEISDLIAAKNQVLTINLPPEPLKANIDAPKVSMALINCSITLCTSHRRRDKFNSIWKSTVPRVAQRGRYRYGDPGRPGQQDFRPVLSGRKPHDASPPGYGLGFPLFKPSLRHTRGVSGPRAWGLTRG